jgi:hypothetical protein
VNALKGGLKSQLLKISSDESMSVTSNLEQIDITVKLHVLHLDFWDFMTTFLV